MFWRGTNRLQAGDLINFVPPANAEGDILPTWGSHVGIQIGPVIRGLLQTFIRNPAGPIFGFRVVETNPKGFTAFVDPAGLETF